jgi:histidinol dehydrogenase
VRVDDVLALEAPAAARAPDLRRGDAGPAGAADVREAVAEIVRRVGREGDAAVLDLTRSLDTGGAEPLRLRVEEAELERALAGLAPPLRDALELAARNVRAVAQAEVEADREVSLEQGQRVLVRGVPVRRAAVYVPGGMAPYPSTVVMGVVAARVAGVEQVAVCAPPRRDGSAHPEVLAACALCGVTEAYRMGGAQAVAALALGTQSVPAVDVVAGPGNEYVQEAKRQLCDRVGVDSFAGPSELLVVLDAGADVRLVALDLLAQAEHGPATQVVAVSDSRPALDAVRSHLTELGAESSPGGRCRLVLVADLEEALALADAYAPEHLQLVGADAERLAPRVRSAGCLFVGAASGTAFGDYVAGSNHVLPTGGAARFASVLSPATFRRRMAEVRIDGAASALAGPGALIARAEGFAVHAESMEARIQDNGGDDG